LDVEPIRRITEKILSQYNRRPKGWSVLADQRGNVLVLGPGSSYWLRLIWLNPREYTGAGIKVDDPEKMRRIVEGTPSYGLRPLPRGSVQKLLRAVQRNGRVEGSLAEKLLSITPVSTRELKKRSPGAILSGPIITHRDLGAISEGQRRLERKLALEAEKLFRKRYPLRSGIYI
jgi:hypothetical protein